LLTQLPFSTRLRSATTSAHGHAETSHFMTAVMAGDIDRETYGVLVCQLQPIYAALDDAAAAHRSDPVYSPFFDPRLDRGQALHADIALLGGQRDITEATRAYSDHLTEVHDDPLLVLAHHYTRYFGDLSGGRAIAARLQTNLGLTPHDGLAFYQFDIGPAPAYKNAYRQKLDALALSRADEDLFIAEVSRAYALNSAVFESLDHLL
jgi:heme oxygenase (biliverdin-producing, ferredoxin)